MENIKSLLLKELQDNLSDYTNVHQAKSFITTARALEDVEKIVFKDAAIALGSSSFELEVYSQGYDKLRHRVEILYFIKSTQAIEDSITNLTSLASNLRLNNFDKTNLINGKLNINYEFIQLTDKVSYALIEYSVLEIQSR